MSRPSDDPRHIETPAVPAADDDTPRLPIEHVVDQASEIISAQERLRTLLRANRSIVGELSLSGVLRRIVEAARDVSGARYAALGVISPHGLLEQFIHVGMDEQTVAAIGKLPEGHGVLGALIKHPEPIRLSNLTEDPRSVGFPDHHPPMTTFLGVPIHSHDEVVGNLYLTNRSGGDFTAEDEEFVLALAATASIAIENARLYEESRQRQEWLRASGEISRRLLAPEQDHHEILQRIAESVKRLADADTAFIVLPAADPTLLEVAVATGDGEQTLRGQRLAAEGSFPGTAMAKGRGVLIDSAQDEFLTRWPASGVARGPMMTFPLIGEVTARGAIVAGRRSGRRTFAAADLDMAEAFANHAAIALELSDARFDQERLAVLEDRDRIAQDLHDHVIQRLFATGLSVQGAASMPPGPELRDRLTRSVDDLDDTIRQIRTSIFELREYRESESLRGTVLSIIRQISPLLQNPPTVEFSGPLDTLADSAIVSDAGAVVRETLTNVVKHARAGRTSVDVSATPDRLSITITDNGIGLSADPPYSGLANLRHRAERRGGELAVSRSSPAGTEVQWTIPLNP